MWWHIGENNNCKMGKNRDRFKTIYTCFATDVIHEGHLNIINEANKYGNLTVGVLSDEAMVSSNRFPLLSFEERMQMVKNLEGISSVVEQKDVMYDEIIYGLHPDYVIHGDNWLSWPQRVLRQNVVELLEKCGGELIEVPYTRNETVRHIDMQIKEKAAMPEYRRRRLRQILEIRGLVKAIEVHSGLTGLIAEKTIIEKDGKMDQFDAMWCSSLCDSTARGKPDIELVDITSRLRSLEEVMEVTTKPIIFDGDTGGKIEHFVYNVRTLERLGVSAVIVEDKIGLKKNSLFGTDVEQSQDDLGHFSQKIHEAKKAQLTDEFMIIARIESLILDKGVADSLERASAYVDAGADAIMIHSRRSTADEIFEFCDGFRAKNKVTPLVVVPSTFPKVYESELKKHGVNIVIYANQLTRSAFPAMKRTAENILRYHRAEEVDASLLPIKDVLSLIEPL